MSTSHSSTLSPGGGVANGKSGNRRRRSRNLLLDLPITWRLTLGFLAAALLASLAVGISGTLRAQSLSRQADFFRNLLQVNTSLTTGSSFLLLMNTKLHETLTDAGAPNPSQETLHTDEAAISGLVSLYNNTLADYIQHDLLDQHPDQVTLLAESGHTSLVAQQHTLLGSAVRTWQVYRTAQAEVLSQVGTGSLGEAQTLLRAQAEPTNADALSALRTLIQFNVQLSSAGDEAVGVEEQQQTLTTILAALLAFLVICLIGWLISKTLVQRLSRLRRVTREVERGQLGTRVEVIGHDEIASVSESVNRMLDTIVGLLEETGKQRDALTNAAAHLFSEMRVVSAGDLRTNAIVSDDPIGMLANAFNFTVGRFRRFVLRTQTTVEQLEVVAHQQEERIATFTRTSGAYPVGTSVTQTIRGRSSGGHRAFATSTAATHRISAAGKATSQSWEGRESDKVVSTIQMQAWQGCEQVLRLASESAQQFQTLLKVTEQARLSIEHMRRLATEQMHSGAGGYGGQSAHFSAAQMQGWEWQALEASMLQSALEWQSFQRKMAEGLSDLEKILLSLSANAARIDIESQSSSAPSFSPAMETETQGYEQVAQKFAQDMLDLTRRFTALVHEMHQSVLPFRPN